ncbi:MAG: GWxTD domain-containing protein [Calditrichia bacterium]|nr:GWxTD domain-containing protein [Calditrichia bacterium]
MDFGRFQYDSTSTFLEVYYQVIVENSSNFLLNDKTVNMNIQLKNLDKDSIIIGQEINNVFKSISPNNISSKLGMIRAVIPDGKYRLVFSYPKKINDTQMDTVVNEFNVVKFKREQIILSDLEMCSNIIMNSAKKDSPFYKNGMEIYPNPSLIFGKNSPVLYYYIELYNLKFYNNKSLQLNAVILDKDGQIIKEKKYNKKYKVDAAVELGSFPVNKLKTGVYRLLFSAGDTLTNESVHRKIIFYVNNDKEKLITFGGELLGQNLFYNMSIEELDLKFKYAKYIARKIDIEIYNRLSGKKEKADFLTEFWKKYARIYGYSHTEYYLRVEKMNEKYTTQNFTGWETDRGRVYILYGPPDEIDYHKFDGISKAYEIWYYRNLDEGVEFDFGDKFGMGNYILLNSTKRGEVHYPNWRNELIPYKKFENGNF